MIKLYNYLSRNGVLIGFLLAVLCILITVIPLFGGLDAFNEIEDKKQAFSEEGGIFMTGISLTVILMYAAVGLMIAMGIVGIFVNFKDSKKGVIAFVALAVFFGILYATSSEDVGGSLAETISNPDFGIQDETGKFLNGTFLNLNVFKLISGTITGTLILLGIAFAVTILMEIWNFFKTA